MLIDWFTVGAQVVNFLILVWVLKRFLYGPIVRVMREREDRVRARLQDARTAREEAEALAARLEEERRGLDAERARIMEEARVEVSAWRDEALEKARGEVRELRESWGQALEEERERLGGTLRQRLAEQVVAVADKVLRDLAGEDLQERVVGRLLERVRADGAFGTLAGEVVLVSGWPAAESRAVGELRSELLARAGVTGVEARTDGSLGFGVRVLAGDHKWDWSLAAYLADIEDAMFAGLAPGGAGAKESA